MMFLARSQSGKTTLLIKLLLGKWLPMFNKVYIFCPTYTQDKKWSCIDPYVLNDQVKVYGSIKKNTLIKIWKHSADYKTKYGDDPNHQYHVLIVFDDCVGQDEFGDHSNSNIINKLVCKGNHANISTVWSIQKITMCSTIMRTQVEAIVVFYCPEKELKTLFQEYGTGKLNWFRKMVELSTSKPYSTLFINRQGPGKPRFFCNFKEIISLDND